MPAGHPLTPTLALHVHVRVARPSTRSRHRVPVPRGRGAEGPAEGPSSALSTAFYPFCLRQYSTLSRDERARARTSGARDEERQRGIRAGRVGFRAFGIHFGGGTRDRSTNRPSPGPGGSSTCSRPVVNCRWSPAPLGTCRERAHFLSFWGKFPIRYVS